MLTLLNPAVTRQLLDRLGRLRPDTPRLWGRMTAHQMVCHLSDSYRLGLGERPVTDASGLFQRTLVKAIALRAPLRWPRGVRTRPESDQEIGGTRPFAFETDVATLAALLNRFAHPQRDFAFGVHPIFGRMSEWEWMRWGYLHADHHLRQFGL